MISDYKKNKNGLQKNEKNQLAFEEFLSFLKKINSDLVNLDKKSRKKMKSEIIRFLQSNYNEDDMAKFHSFYYSLSLSEDKVELCKNNITGDISMYPNHHAVLDAYIKGQLVIDELSVNYIHLGSGVGIAGIGVTIGGITGRILAERIAAETTIGLSLTGATVAGATIVGVALVAAEIGVNLIAASANSGYFEKECCYEGKLLRIDCNIFNR